MSPEEKEEAIQQMIDNYLVARHEREHEITEWNKTYELFQLLEQ